MTKTTDSGKHLSLIDLNRFFEQDYPGISVILEKDHKGYPPPKGIK